MTQFTNSKTTDAQLTQVTSMFFITKKQNACRSAAVYIVMGRKQSSSHLITVLIRHWQQFVSCTLLKLQHNIQTSELAVTMPWPWVQCCLFCTRQYFYCDQSTPQLYRFSFSKSLKTLFWSFTSSNRRLSSMSSLSCIIHVIGIPKKSTLTERVQPSLPLHRLV